MDCRPGLLTEAVLAALGGVLVVTGGLIDPGLCCLDRVEGTLLPRARDIADRVGAFPFQFEREGGGGATDLDHVTDSVDLLSAAEDRVGPLGGIDQDGDHWNGENRDQFGPDPPVRRGSDVRRYPPQAAGGRRGNRRRTDAMPTVVGGLLRRHWGCRGRVDAPAGYRLSAHVPSQPLRQPPGTRRTRMARYRARMSLDRHLSGTDRRPERRLP